jgi:hypothetical protein
MRFIALGAALRRSDSPAMRGLMLALRDVNADGIYFLPGGAFHDVVAQSVLHLASMMWNAGFLQFASRRASEGELLWSRAAVRRRFWILAMAFVAMALFDIAANNALVGAALEQAVRRLWIGLT